MEWLRADEAVPRWWLAGVLAVLWIETLWLAAALWRTW